VNDKRLYRSRDDKMISGVAGGLAEYFDMDPTLVRLIWVALTLLTSGVMILIYIIMAIVVPEAPAEGEPHDPRAMSSDDIAKGAQAFGNDVSEAARRFTTSGVHPGEDKTTDAGGNVAPAAAAPPPPAPYVPARRHERRGAAGLILGAILVFVGAALLVERVTGIDVWWFFGLGWRVILPLLIIAFGVLVILRAAGRR
jgi:phage shock protein PspC (stress-responsive transcriptional regulator)